MKFTTEIKIIISALLVWQSCLAEEVKTYQADICVYGGTASGVMAALAAKKEGAKVILIEPTRYLGGMTGGGIHHLDWGKGNTVGGSTYKMLTEGIKDQNRRTNVSLNGVGNKEYRERFRKAIDTAEIKVIYEHRLGKVQVGGKTIEHPTRQKPIALGEKFSSKKQEHSIRSIILDYAPVDETGCPPPQPKKRD
ncbi:MAG: FAD-dependent oxidoreductase, partial [Opitutales bacterium]